MRGDARLALVGADDGSLSVWSPSAQRAERMARVAGLKGEARRLAFLPPNGTTAVSVDRHDLRIWDVSTPQQPREVARAPAGDWFDRSPDGRRWVLWDPVRVRVWDAGSQNPERWLHWPGRPFTADPGQVRWSADGQQLVGYAQRSRAGTPASCVVWSVDGGELTNGQADPLAQLGAQAPCRTGRGRRDVAGLRVGAGGSPPRPAGSIVARTGRCPSGDGSSRSRT